MKQWYRRTLTKVIVLIIGILSGAAFITSLGVALAFAGTVNPSQIMRLVNEPYEESEDFNLVMEETVSEVFEMFRLQDVFETDGAYDPDKAVDIMEYADSGRTGGGNTSGVVYALNNLIKWGENFNAADDGVYNNNVVVCQRDDGSYYYYYLDDFLAQIENGALTIEFDDEYQTQASFLKELADGNLNGSEAGYGLKIYNAEGSQLYTDCWNFGAALREDYAPEGADNLLQIVNSNPELNGKLSVIYDNLTFALTNIYSDYTTYQSGWEYLEEGNTNFTYLYADRTAKQVFTNKSGYTDYKGIEEHIGEMKSGDSVKYIIVYPKLKDFETNMSISASGEWDSVRAYEPSRDSENILAVSLDIEYPIKDQFYEGSMIYNSNLPFLRWALFLFMAGGILFLVSAVWLAVAAGKKPGDEEVHLTVFDRWKTEISAVLVIGLWVAFTSVVLGMGTTLGNWGTTEAITETQYYTGELAERTISSTYSTLFTSSIDMADLMGLFFYGTFSFVCFFAGYVSLIRRVKAKILWKGSLLYAMMSVCGQMWRERAVTLKAGVTVFAFLFIQWVAILFHNIPSLLLALAADIFVIWLVLTGAVAKNRIRKGIEEIAGGNLEYRIDLKWLRGAERDIAEKINNIGSGLNKAVDEAMRNERLKTDLITNVSHDIKTPLTSIINYVDILKRSNITDEKIRGYLDILEAKAQRLKTLTEDVVEASKVSSGNITLEYMDMDLRELVQQTEGELAEKFAARRLTMVLNIPEEPAVIHVDGRRMWRVLENVFGNAAKYAMPGTRVYADIILTENQICFSLKNVSEQQLNISADELTERFIRGDISRSTEGSGLGLSIAKSLTTMQGGEFELYLDGDLFRVNIRFPRVRSKAV